RGRTQVHTRAAQQDVTADGLHARPPAAAGELHRPTHRFGRHIGGRPHHVNSTPHAVQIERPVDTYHVDVRRGGLHPDARATRHTHLELGPTSHDELAHVGGTRCGQAYRATARHRQAVR